MRSRKITTTTGTPLAGSQMDGKVSGATETPTARAGLEIDSRPPSGFEVREGDRLTVLYNGAKLQIAPFSSVEIDAGIYSRSLEPGDDAVEQWDRVHAFLERKCLERARAKLRAYAEELAEAKAIASGGRR